MRKLEELSKKELILLVERYERILSLRVADAKLDNGPSMEEVGESFAYRPRRKRITGGGIVIDKRT